MTTANTKKIPTPLYAAAGVGDLAYQEIRKLPERVSQLRGRAVELRPVVADAMSEDRLKADLDRLRTVARRNASTLIDNAHAAQERAAAVYSDLVARGERVVQSAKAERAGEAEPAETPVVEIEAAAADQPEAVADRPAAETAEADQK